MRLKQEKTMTAKSTKTFYWSASIIFGILMFLDGIGGVTKQEAGQEVMRHLGYPVYVLVIFGIAKLLGAVAIMQTKYSTIKEWAYAGFAFNFIGAFASRLFVGDSLSEIIFPVVMLAVLCVPYFAWKKFEGIKLISSSSQL
jgi:hypothetical protein